MEKLSLKSSELEEIIIRIFNETYEDFVNKYGEKHKEYIKQMLENISDKVKKIEMFEGASASANVKMGIVSSFRNKLATNKKSELDSYIFDINETQRNRVNGNLSLKDIGNSTQTIGLQEIDAITQEVKHIYKQKIGEIEEYHK